MSEGSEEAQVQQQQLQGVSAADSQELPVAQFLHEELKEQEKNEEEEQVVVQVDSSSDTHTTILTSPHGHLVYLLGTMHVSEASCEDVRQLIRRIRPRAVAVELCAARTPMLKMTAIRELSLSEMITQLKTKQTTVFALLYSSLLSKIAGKLKVLPGAEFRTAYEEAMAQKIKVYLVDRPVQITVARVWGALSTWEKTKFCWAMVYQSIFLPSAEELQNLLESLKESDMLLAALKECQEEFPSLISPLLTERDLFLTARIRSCADRVGGTLVAVVGKGHVQGIVENWESEIDVARLLEIPQKKGIVSSANLVKISIVLTTVGCLVGGGFAAISVSRWMIGRIWKKE